MKKILTYVLFMVAMITVFSCRKGDPIVPDTTPSITVISLNGGEVATAGQDLDVRWKTHNVPPGSAISLILIKNINGIDNEVIAYLAPEDDNGFVKGSTIDDGEEKFHIPSDIGTPNIMFGTTFKIMLQVEYPDVSGFTQPIVTGESKSYFTILQAPWRDGCTSIFGFSVTSGQPCKIN